MKNCLLAVYPQACNGAPLLLSPTESSGSCEKQLPWLVGCSVEKYALPISYSIQNHAKECFVTGRSLLLPSGIRQSRMLEM